MAFATGLFEGALQLSLRLLAEYTVLGFVLNMCGKSTIVPTYYYCHIGVCINSVSMRFSLPHKRIQKIVLSIQHLSAVAVIGKSVDAKLVARLVGQLWSANIVCCRAVAVMARAMIHTIATMIRGSGVVHEPDLRKLRFLLKRVWGGSVIWTAEAQIELDFWRRVRFENLSSPISYDAVGEKLKAWMADPESGKLTPAVRVFAVDTSDSMSGGGEFIRDGVLWKMCGVMAVRLSPEEIDTSSTMRELLGVRRLDLAIIPDECPKVLLPLDSQAAEHCILFGSKVPALQKIVRDIFFNQLRHGRIL